MSKIFPKVYLEFLIFNLELRTCLVDCNSNYIGIWIDITKNTKCCNVMLITIHLFGDNIIIELWRQQNESILNQT